MPDLIPAPKPADPAAFNTWLGAAMREASAETMTPDHALRSGVDVYGLVRYAAGVCSGSERTELEAQLSRSPWAMGRVVALVKLTRNAAPLSHREATAHLLLHAARTGDWSRFIPAGLDDPEAHLAGVLDSSARV